MKKILTVTLISSLVAAPFAMAKGSFDDAERMLKAGTDYGITHFQSIEFDDDRADDIEIEGWMGKDWFVELDLNGSGDIDREQRRKPKGEVYGLSADDVRDYLDAAQQQGIQTFEELKVKRSGQIQVEGDDENGRELEVDFRAGSFEPVRVKKDH
ncbi:hypothetical protein KUV59_08680 [Marinobacter daepoensis]|uniref:hypothetical protein n=1 Tax=Marinobacter daepoensis TaxID=262077 RepID=UPI001C97AABB|nr:hypothetical protein [Marinobacter daepoensis]MBY6033240.1 hypothetical protein [Marinobacter daepoensis]